MQPAARGSYPQRSANARGLCAGGQWAKAARGWLGPGAVHHELTVTTASPADSAQASTLGHRLGLAIQNATALPAQHCPTALFLAAPPAQQRGPGLRNCSTMETLIAAPTDRSAAAPAVPAMPAGPEPPPPCRGAADGRG